MTIRQVAINAVHDERAKEELKTTALFTLAFIAGGVLGIIGGLAVFG